MVKRETPNENVGPPVHVRCYQCKEWDSQVEYLNTEGVREPYCHNCYEDMQDYTEFTYA